MVEKPKVNSAGERELSRAEKQLETFNQDVKELVSNRPMALERSESEPQAKLSSKDVQHSKDVYLKPEKSISAVDSKSGEKQKFNEKFRSQYEFDREYVHFIAQHNEILGDTIEIWTRPYGGMPAEFWKVPTNKPVWGPRYLAEQIKRKFYHRLKTENSVMTGGDSSMQYHGALVVDTTVNRLDAFPVSAKKSIFMSSGSF